MKPPVKSSMDGTKLPTSEEKIKMLNAITSENCCPIPVLYSCRILKPIC